MLPGMPVRVFLRDKVEAQWNVNKAIRGLLDIEALDKVEAQWNVNT